MFDKKLVCQDVNNRLNMLGFEGDFTEITEYYCRVIYDEILANLNLKSLPLRLYSIYIDMVSGEVLLNLYLTGKLDDYIPDKISKEDLTSINAGDTTYGINAGTSKRKQIEDLIDSLRNPKDRTYLFDCFRDFIR